MGDLIHEPDPPFQGRRPLFLDDEEPVDAAGPAPAAREQEDSIKDRKKLLFEADEPAFSALSIERKPFAVHLRETPAAPLSGSIRAMLWAAGIVVGLLLAAAAYKASQPKAKPEADPGAARAGRGA